MKSETLAFLPARKGSKGILNKNMVELCGKPLIYFTLATIRELGSKVVPFVSTDSDVIADYCDTQGFPIRYRRPDALSGDRQSVVSAILDALDWLEVNDNYCPKNILVLQPTSPIRVTEEIRCALRLYKNAGLESLVSVTKMREHPFECVESTDEDAWEFLREPDETVVGRQMYPSIFYFIDGNFYLSSVKFIRDEKALVRSGKTRLFGTAQRWPVDIDEIDDLKVASALIKG